MDWFFTRIEKLYEELKRKYGKGGEIPYWLVAEMTLTVIKPPRT